MVKHLNNIEIVSDSINRSGLTTENMTSSTPDKLVGTTFKSVLVNENGEFVVGEDGTNIQSDWDEIDPLAPSYIQNKPDALLQQIQYPTFSSLPVTGDDRVIYYMQDDGTLWIWDITTSAYIEVETGSGIVYSLADGTVVGMTIGNRGLASTGSGADKTYETSQTIDPLTGNTIDQTFEGGNVNFIDTIITNEDSTINNINTVTNNDENSNINNNGNTINNNGNTTNNTDVTENWDGDNIVNLTENSSITNNLDGTVTNNLGDTYVENNTYEDGATINNEGSVDVNYNNYTEDNNYTNTTVNNSGEVTNNYDDTYVENNNYDSSSVVNNEGGTINNTDQTINNDNTTVENTNVTENYDSTSVTNNNGNTINNIGVTENYDNTSNITYEGDVNYEGNTTMENLVVNNVTFPGGNVFVNGIGNWEVTDEAVSEYSLVATPMSEGSVIVWADSGTGLFPLAPASDYTYDALLNKITFSTPLGTGERAYIWILSGNANANIGGVSYTETFIATAGQTEFNLSDTPAGEDWIWVSTRSGLYGKLGSALDYEYDSVTNKIILPAQDDGDVIQVRYIGFVNPIPPVTEFTFDAVELNTGTHNAETNEYILVTYTGGDTIINLPDASLNNGKQVKIKKFTGEDVLTTTILPYGTQLIDGFTGATMNINRTMYTFTAINGNWYLGD